MAYLSRLVLNPRTKQSQKDIRNPYEMHRTLSKAFGEGKELQQEARCLFRIEQEEVDAGVLVLVQSRVAPDWNKLTVEPDYWRTAPQIKKVEFDLPAGTPLNFRLKANPTVYQNEKRVPIRGEDAQLAWLQRKGIDHGFHVRDVRVLSPEILNFKSAGGNPITLQAVLFNGTLVIDDAARFAKAWQEGIGRGKGFGLGLLSLARRLR